MKKTSAPTSRHLPFRPKDGIAWLRVKAAGPTRFYTELAAVVRRYHRERIGRMIDTRRIYWTLKDQMRNWSMNAEEMRRETGIFQLEGRWYVELAVFLPWLEKWYQRCFVASVPKPDPLPAQWDGTPAALPAGVYSLRAVCDGLQLKQAFARLKQGANRVGTGIYQAKEYVVEWPNKLILAEWGLKPSGVSERV